MFSFFKSKKPSPDQTPSEPIPGPVPSPPREDSFIFIERRPIPSSGGGATDEWNSRGPAGDPSISSVGAVGPGQDTPATSPTVTRHRSEEKVGHYALHGVPFRLGTEVDSSYTDPDMTRLQVTEILTFIGRASAMEHGISVDYDFALERSVLLE
uniref:UMA domain-containing protein n=2 Tax=Anopheles triannulatus TaxID=58253 RepID=A0A2M4AR19_9DIPT